VRRLSFLTGLLLAFGAALLFRRRSATRRERVDLYYEDGSMVSLEGRTPETERLLALAREALATSRGGP
jgi:hypothetical protein